MTKPLWQCPKCRRRFANRNQQHACGRHTLAAYLKGKDPTMVALYEELAALIRKCGPLTLEATKSRIQFKVRMTFASLDIKKRWLDVGLIFAKRVEHPRFTGIWSVSPRNHLHTLRIASADDLNDQLAGWLRQAYAVGEQKHLGPVGLRP